MLSLFSTLLNKLFHITDVYIFSTRQNNNWIYKNDLVQKFTYPWILILWCFLDDPRLSVCVVIVVHESLVGSEQFLLFFRTILQLRHILWVSSIFCIFEPFPTVTVYDFEIHIFTWRAIGGLIHNYYIRWKHLLMLKKATQCIKSWLLVFLRIHS